MEIERSLIKEKPNGVEYKDLPSFATISNDHCIDIVESLKHCITKATNSDSNTTSIQKDYKHLIYYPEYELNKCVAYKEFLLNHKNLNIVVKDKTNIHRHYNVHYDKSKQSLNIEL
jgi:hypothetical protein